MFAPACQLALESCNCILGSFYGSHLQDGDNILLMNQQYGSDWANMYLFVLQTCNLVDIFSESGFER